MTISTTATALASAAAAAELRRLVDDQRSLPELPLATVEESLRSMIRGKIWWLQQFRAGRNARPAHELNSKGRELRALVQAYDMIKGRGALEKEAPS